LVAGRGGRGVADRIDRIAPARETLAALPATRHIDLAFVDADKPSYRDYLGELIPRMVPNGVILVDNVLWSGSVVDPAATDPDTEAIRACNAALAADDRVDVVILPIADGLAFVRVH
jgi:caffeoyl-CoA O-methyltransferase